MPANLTPQYLEAEKRFRAAKTVEEKMAALEEMLAVIPKHKGTDHLQGDLKRRLAKLRAEAEQAHRRRGFSIAVEREGAGQVVLVGPPNAGKSLLVGRLTNAHAEVGEYPFTTQRPFAGMMPYLDIQIQLVDLPAISADHMEPWVPGLVRPADLALLVVDLASPSALEDVQELIAVLARSKVSLVPPGSPPAPAGWAYIGTLLLANKADDPAADETRDILVSYFASQFLFHTVSAKTGLGLEPLRPLIYEGLGIVRVYSKPPGEEPSLDSPVVLPRGSTIMDLARAIHKDFAARLRYARVWGGTKFGGQRVHRDYIVQEGDIIELHL